MLGVKYRASIINTNPQRRRSDAWRSLTCVPRTREQSLLALLLVPMLLSLPCTQSPSSHLALLLSAAPFPTPLLSSSPRRQPGRGTKGLRRGAASFSFPWNQPLPHLSAPSVTDAWSLWEASWTQYTSLMSQSGDLQDSLWLKDIVSQMIH